MTTKITRDETTSQRSIRAESNDLIFDLSMKIDKTGTTAELMIGSLLLELVTPATLRDWSQTLLTLAAKMEEEK